MQAYSLATGVHHDLNRLSVQSEAQHSHAVPPATGLLLARPGLCRRRRLLEEELKGEQHPVREGLWGQAAGVQLPGAGLRTLEAAPHLAPVQPVRGKVGQRQDTRLDVTLVCSVVVQTAPGAYVVAAVQPIQDQLHSKLAASGMHMCVPCCEAVLFC